MNTLLQPLDPRLTALEPIHFDSIAELASAPFRNPENARVCKCELGDVGSWVSQTDWDMRAGRWLGTSSEEEAARRVTHGWPEGADKVLSAMSSMQVPPPINIKRRLVRDDHGDELDIHATYRGDFGTAWTSRRRRPTRSSTIVRVVAQCNLLAHTSFSELFWRGGAVLKLADALSEAGYNVEVVGAIASQDVRGWVGDWLVTFPLKESRNPMDSAQLAGVMCNAGFHRLIGFRLYFALATGSHGYPGAARSDTSGHVIRRGNLGADGKPTFSVPYGIGNKQAAESWVSACITKLQEDLHN